MAVTLSMVRPLDGEVAHLPLDHAGVGAIAPWRVDLGCDLTNEVLVVIIIAVEGGKSPESRFWTG